MFTLVSYSTHSPSFYVHLIFGKKNGCTLDENRSGSFYFYSLSPFTLPKPSLSPPPPHPTIPFSLLSSCSLFYFHPCSRTPLTERPGLIHMSHRFMEIPIVFSQCAPLRGPWVACVSQHGLIYPISAPHYFTRLSHTMPHMQSHLEKCRCACKMSESLCTLSHTVLLHLNLTTCHLVQTGPSTNSTI